MPNCLTVQVQFGLESCILATSSGEDINKNEIFGLWLKKGKWFFTSGTVMDSGRIFGVCSELVSQNTSAGQVCKLTWVNVPSSRTPTHITHSETRCVRTVWRCFPSCLPSFSSLSYSWAICLGKCCVRCVSNRTSSVPAVHLLIVSSSTSLRSLAHCALNHSLCGHLYLR